MKLLLPLALAVFISCVALSEAGRKSPSKKPSSKTPSTSNSKKTPPNKKPSPSSSPRENSKPAQVKKNIAGLSAAERLRQRQAQQACYQDGTLHKKGDKWQYKNFEWKCKGVSRRRGKGRKVQADFVVVKTGCVLPNGQVLNGGKKKKVGGSKYTCKKLKDKDLELQEINGGKKRTTAVRPASDVDMDCRLAFCSVKSGYDKPNCYASGDPHTYTFDSKKHDYQGTCRYTFVALKNPIKPNFRVVLKTEHRAGKERTGKYGDRVSFVKYIEIQVYDKVFRLHTGGKLTVDDAEVSVPFFHPPMPDDACDQQSVSCQVNVIKKGTKGLLLNTEFGVAVEHDGSHKVAVHIPKGLKGNTEGTCGQYDGDSSNDWAFPNGTTTENYNLMGDSWTEPDDDEPDCTRLGDTPPLSCDPAQEAAAKEKCSVMTDTNGPFAACLKDGDFMALAKQLQSDCEFDYCAFDGDEETVCAAISAITDKCQAAVATVDEKGDTIGVIISWRTKDRCPMQCPAGKHFEACASPCPATCNSLEPACAAVCVEDCVCDEGTVLDPATGDCIKESTCGCIDPEMNYRKVNEKWLSPDCGLSCECKNAGEIVCEDEVCEAPFVCKPDRSNPRSNVCGCDKGYRLSADKKKCEDINECQEKAGLCGPNSVCVNKEPGYDCECELGHQRVGRICEFIAPPPPTPTVPATDTPTPPIEPTTTPPPTTPPTPLCPPMVWPTLLPGCTLIESEDEMGCPTFTVECVPICPLTTLPPPEEFCQYVTLNTEPCQTYDIVCSTKPPPTCKPKEQTSPYNSKYCFWMDDGVDDSGCPKWAAVCESAPQAPATPGPPGTTPTTPGTTTPACLPTPLAQPAEGCMYIQSGLDNYGCPQYTMVCPSPLEPTCPPVTVPPPPSDPYCQYLSSKNADGCIEYMMACAGGEPEPILTTVPPVTANIPTEPTTPPVLNNPLTCEQGYKINGNICDDVNECESGENRCEVNEVCVNKPGSYSCVCEEGLARSPEGMCQDVVCCP